MLLCDECGEEEGTVPLGSDLVYCEDCYNKAVEYYRIEMLEKEKEYK